MLHCNKLSLVALTYCACQLGSRLGKPGEILLALNLLFLVFNLLPRLTSSPEKPVEAKHSFPEDLSRLNHDLRTPLTTILGFSDLLASRNCGELNAKQRQYVDRIYFSGLELLSLIGDIMELAKWESPQGSLNATQFSADKVVRAAAKNLAVNAKRRGVEFSFEVNPDLEAWGDPLVIRNSLERLLDNAIKFSNPGGQIDIRVRDSGGTLFEVRDTGPGVPLEMHRNIFEAFDRQSGHRASQGLGLYLVRRAATHHLGEVWVESSGVRGEGSIFYIWLPPQPQAPVA